MRIIFLEYIKRENRQKCNKNTAQKLKSFLCSIFVSNFGFLSFIYEVACVDFLDTLCFTRSTKAQYPWITIRPNTFNATGFRPHAVVFGDCNQSLKANIGGIRPSEQFSNTLHF